MQKSISFTIKTLVTFENKIRSMKLKKSLLSLIILAVIVLSSCSQARYGSLTRRTKATHVAQTTKKVETSKPDVVLKVVAEVPETYRIDSEIVGAVAEMQHAAANLDQTPNKGATSSSLASKEAVTKPKTLKNRKLQQVVNTFGTVNQVKNVKSQLDKMNDVKRTSSSDVDNLVYILVVVLLVLLILALVSRLSGLLSALLGLALLILLIYLLLQLI